jgi:Hypothetical protein (DUF2513)
MNDYAATPTTKNRATASGTARYNPDQHVAALGIDMKLEPDLIRELLIYVETHATDPISELEEIVIAGWTAATIQYHVILASEANFIVADIVEVPDGENEKITHISYTVSRLTFQGHEFLGTVRDSKHWKAIKTGAASAGIATISAIAIFAGEYAKNEIARKFGISLN